MLQCNYSFANFQTFVNTGYRNNPCHFSWRVWMLNHLLTSFNSELTNLEKTVTRQNRQGISPRYPSFSFWEEQSLALTSTGLKMQKKQLLMVRNRPVPACWVNQKLWCIVWSTVTEWSSASKPCGMWQSQKRYSRYSHHQLRGYNSLL